MWKSILSRTQRSSRPVAKYAEYMLTREQIVAKAAAAKPSSVPDTTDDLISLDVKGHTRITLDPTSDFKIKRGDATLEVVGDREIPRHVLWKSRG